VRRFDMKQITGTEFKSEVLCAKEPVVKEKIDRDAN
jgi:hypothetical protein